MSKYDNSNNNNNDNNSNNNVNNNKLILRCRWFLCVCCLTYEVVTSASIVVIEHKSFCQMKHKYIRQALI